MSSACAANVQCLQPCRAVLYCAVLRAFVLHHTPPHTMLQYVCLCVCVSTHTDMHTCMQSCIHTPLPPRWLCCSRMKPRALAKCRHTQSWSVSTCLRESVSLTPKPLKAASRGAAPCSCRPRVAGAGRSAACDDARTKTNSEFPCQASSTAQPVWGVDHLMLSQSVLPHDRRR